jgi:hypothetical protein
VIRAVSRRTCQRASASAFLPLVVEARHFPAGGNRAVVEANAWKSMTSLRSL